MRRGIPWHPALVHLPVAAWTAAPALGVAVRLGAPPELWPVAWWSGAVGVIAAMPAMAAGLFDMTRLSEHRSRDLVLWHMGGMLMAWSLEITALLVARPGPALEASWVWLTAVSFAFLIMAVSAHIGGRLVYVHGAGRTSRTQRGS